MNPDSQLDRLQTYDDSSLVPIVLKASGKGKISREALIRLDDEVIGAIEYGDYCLDTGCGKGITCLTVSSVIRILKQGGVCTVQNINSPVPRPAILYIS